jgi:tetratricopeptide (TPR) repeat protein
MRLGQQAQAAGRPLEAVSLYRQAVQAAPESGVAEHNLASALGDSGLWAEAELHTALAFRKGVDAPETWLIRGRALQAQDKAEDAERAFREALKRRPAYADAHRDLAQQVWMLTGDTAKMLNVLDEALAKAPLDIGLWLVKAQSLETAGDVAGAWEQLSALLKAQPGDARLANFTSQLALKVGRASDALVLASSAARAAAGEPVVLIALADAQLANGMAREALQTADALLARQPANQHAIALKATAWRILGDARFHELYDYASMVRAYELDTPEGWSSLSAYVDDLGEALHGVHRHQAHPFAQSLRHGSQSINILHNPLPAMRGIREALDGPIRRHMASLSAGNDPLRSRNTGAYDFQGMWSVRLHSGGYHIDHVHPQGWLSSACYVETVAPRGKEGWIRFGKPGSQTAPELEPEHYVEPKPGMLVLFPSYMWHGTVPFSGDQTRLTFAFDLVPGVAPKAV